MLSAAVLLAATACGSLAPAHQTPAAPTPDQTRPPAPTATPPHPTATPARARIPPDLPLSADGPWLVFENTQGLWAVNADGTGLTRILAPESSELEPGLFAISPAPMGGVLTVIVVEDAPPFPRPHLSLVSLPDVDIRTVADLLPEGYASLGDESYFALKALTEWSSPAWSPNGRWLAFAGGMDGASTDLYIYDMATSQTTRLTSGPTQVIGIEWSPDGEWIVHGGAVGIYQGSGMPYEVQEEWAARADGSQVKSLYQLEGSWVDPVLGWLDPQTYVTYSLDYAGAPSWPPYRLRAVDLLTGGSHLLHEAHFTQVAWDPGRKMALVGFAPDEFSYFPPETPTGLRLIDAQTGAETIVTEDEALDALWSPELDLFIAATETGILAIQPTTGEFIDLLIPEGAVGPPQPSQGGDLAWVGDGLWVGTLLSSLDDPPRQILSRPTSFATWAPDGSGLLFFTEGALVYAASPDFSPVLAAETMSDPAAHDWVMP